MTKTYLVDTTVRLAIEASSEEEAKQLAGEELGSLDTFVTAKHVDLTVSKYLDPWE